MIMQSLFRMSSRSRGSKFDVRSSTFKGRLYFLLLCGPVALPAALSTASRSSEISPPSPLREFRAAWVATVANIDWPSRKDLTTAEQKAELLAILDRAQHLKLNAIIFQVRPACDALYASAIEPWSEYLTGTMGKAPEPYYDPLQFAIEEAHKRGLELHAWFNPYRARLFSAQSTVSASHISKTRPQIVRQYGKFLWLDPGEKAVQDYSLSVVMDVVKRYDIDGVHFDDYFYPYKEKDDSGKTLDFPDEVSWKRYGAGGKLSRDDWRRENVNTFIERLYRSIKAARPEVKFGISPFGIWQPKNPPQIEGYDAYSNLYADSRKWLSKGWVDYFAPQLYWAIEPREQSFPVLLKWWAQQNTKGRLLAPGLDSTKTRNRWKPEEIVNQIRIGRQQSGVGGHIHWNMKTLMRNDALDEALVREVYSQPALMPAATWLGARRPGKPTLFISDNQNFYKAAISWTPGSTINPWLWLVQTRTGNQWMTEIFPGSRKSRMCGDTEVIAVSAVDRYGNTSQPAILKLKQ
jgi:uncharacterized lipoprotein YddW (UPF0748 family)